MKHKIPWGVVRLEFRNEKGRCWRNSRPHGPSRCRSSVKAGLRQPHSRSACAATTWARERRNQSWASVGRCWRLGRRLGAAASCRSTSPPTFGIPRYQEPASTDAGHARFTGRPRPSPRWPAYFESFENFHHPASADQRAGKKGAEEGAREKRKREGKHKP